MGKPNKNLVLAAMVFAVAMTFIDQTIVAIAIPQDPEGAVALTERRRSGSSTATCWRWRRRSRSAAGSADVLRPPADGGRWAIVGFGVASAGVRADAARAASRRRG